MKDGGGVNLGGHIVYIDGHSAGSNLVIRFSGNFSQNRASCGGAVSIKHEKNVILKHISATGSMGSAICIFRSSVDFYYSGRLDNNSATLGGGIHSVMSTLHFIGYGLFQDNTALSGGAI